MEDRERPRIHKHKEITTNLNYCGSCCTSRHFWFGTYTGYTQKNGAVLKVNKKFIFYLTQAQRTPSTAVTVQVSHALAAVRFSCLLQGRGASFQDGVAEGKDFLCAPF